MDRNSRKRLEYWEQFPLDESGAPTNYLSYRLVRTLFTEPRRWYLLDELPQLLASDRDHIDVMLRQLRSIDMATSHERRPDCWKYNLSCRNVEFQAKVEGFLADTDISGLPNHFLAAATRSASD